MLSLDDHTLDKLARLVREHSRPVSLGRVLKVTGSILEAHVIGARVGDTVEIERTGGRFAGEVIGFRDNHALIIPLSNVQGLAAGARVHAKAGSADLAVGDALLGRAIDPFGNPIDGGPPIHSKVRVPIDREAPALETRGPISERLDTGVRVLDGLLTCGRGQRVGIFAGAGVGKTVLIRQLASQCSADVTVVGLIGERGCEVQELVGAGMRSRCVVVAATSDRPPLERVRGARSATAVAEYFRDRGAHVMLILDSLTRYAMALREIGLATGEPPATKGYPPSVFAALPRLLERVAPMRGGASITGIYTVLVEGDDLADPVADAARSLLDGHIVLSRDMAARGHFPAVDVLASASRVLHKVTTEAAQALMQRARTVLAHRREAEELRSLGAYVPGASPPHDEALAKGRELDEWSRQAPADCADYDGSMAWLARVLDGKAAQ